MAANLNFSFSTKLSAALPPTSAQAISTTLVCCPIPRSALTRVATIALRQALPEAFPFADTFLNTSQITFSFTGTENEDFTLYLAILDPPLTSASYDSGALNVGTFELAALTGSVLTFTGTPGGISNAVGGGSVGFDVTALDDTDAPEPASMLLVGFGLTGLTIAAMRWRLAGR
jgi:hypothetical protein